MGGGVRVGDVSPESAMRHRQAGAQRQRDYVAWLAEAGQTSEARLSEAALAHKRGLGLSQQVSVGGVQVWVPVDPKEPSAEDVERSTMAVARIAGRTAPGCGLQMPWSCVLSRRWFGSCR